MSPSLPTSAGRSPYADRPVTVSVKELAFTYPGIDGQPPPGAKPLIEGFSMDLRAGDRCLLVGANGAGTDAMSSLAMLMASGLLGGCKCLSCLGHVKMASLMLKIYAAELIGLGRTLLHGLSACQSVWQRQGCSISHHIAREKHEVYWTSSSIYQSYAASWTTWNRRGI